MEEKLSKKEIKQIRELINSRVDVKIKKLDGNALLPSYAHEGDAGMDLMANEDVIIPPLKRVLVSTGIALEIPIGYEVQVRPKSGLAINKGLTLLNTPGTIDAGYRGELKVILVNLGQELIEIKKGMKIAQLVLAKVFVANILESETLSESERQDGGFGSTGL